MKKLIFITLSGVLLSPVFAGNTKIELTKEQEYEFFEKNGLPVPGTGVHVIPATKMKGISTSHIKQDRLSMASLGYVKEPCPDAVNLIQMEKEAEIDIRNNIDNHFIENSHMKKHSFDVPMGYVYKEVDQHLINKVIGFAPMGTYLKNKGWTGNAEYFKPLGFDSQVICSYSESNLELTGGAANLAKEIVSYDINNKITVLYVKGNEQTAFSYEIEWWDNSFRRELICASNDFSKETTAKVIDLAKAIDSFKIN